MKKTILSLAIILVVFVGVGTTVAYASGSLSFVSLVERLIEVGIIPEQKAQEALAAAVRLEPYREQETTSEVMNAQKVDVVVSQLIEHSDLSYKENEPIKGLLLLVKNTTTDATVLEAKRGCQVVYQIYDEDDELVYDGAASERCQTDEKVTYLLEGNDTRMFSVSHDSALAPLPVGAYRFELEYPGYGSGEKTVTIVAE